jgi:hypothetical protein
MTDNKLMINPTTKPKATRKQQQQSGEKTKSNTAITEVKLVL